MADVLTNLSLYTSLLFPAIYMGDQFEVDILLRLTQYYSYSSCLLVMPHIFVSVFQANIINKSME